VSARSAREISEEERRYEDGEDPRVLDIIEIEMSRPQPQNHQQENHLIDDGHYWAKRGVVSWADLERLVEDPAGPSGSMGTRASTATTTASPRTAWVG